MAFALDMVLNHKLFQTQRAQEMPPDQGPPQRRAWDINTEYLRSPVFYVKLAEIVSLLKLALAFFSLKHAVTEHFSEKYTNLGTEELVYSQS